MQTAFEQAQRALSAALNQFKEKQTLMQRHMDKAMRLEQRIEELRNFEYPNTNELCILVKKYCLNLFVFFFHFLSKKPSSSFF